MNSTAYRTDEKVKSNYAETRLEIRNLKFSSQAYCMLNIFHKFFETAQMENIVQTSNNITNIVFCRNAPSNKRR